MTEFLTITIFTVLAIMLPGPDFLMVSKNTISYDKTVGIYTASGIALGAFLLALFSFFSLALVITESRSLFSLIKLCGAGYLIYLGYNELFNTSRAQLETAKANTTSLPHFFAFKQGFLCSALNPKAALFFLSLFTFLIKPDTSFFVQTAYSVEVAMLYLIWFIFLASTLADQRYQDTLHRILPYTHQVLGILLMVFGIHIALSVLI